MPLPRLHPTMTKRWSMLVPSGAARAWDALTSPGPSIWMNALRLAHRARQTLRSSPHTGAGSDRRRAHAAPRLESQAPLPPPKRRSARDAEARASRWIRTRSRARRRVRAHRWRRLPQLKGAREVRPSLLRQLQGWKDRPRRFSRSSSNRRASCPQALATSGPPLAHASRDRSHISPGKRGTS